MAQGAYHTAFEQASSELSEIVREFDRLRARKERIEGLIEVLEPIVGVGAPVAVENRQEDSHDFSYMSHARS